VIDGASNGTTALAWVMGGAVAVNPVTNEVCVANGRRQTTCFVIQDAPVYNTKVRLEYTRLPDDTTLLARPALTGKAVNRWGPWPDGDDGRAETAWEVCGCRGNGRT